MWIAARNASSDTFFTVYGDVFCQQTYHEEQSHGAPDSGTTWNATSSNSVEAS
jgi:hypothetical protein